MSPKLLSARMSAGLLEIPPHETVDVLAKAGGRVDQAGLLFTVLNVLLALRQNPKIRLAVSVPSTEMAE